MEMQLSLRINRSNSDPPHESIETETAFILVVYLSGAEKDDIQISIDDEGTEIYIGTRARTSFVEKLRSRSFALGTEARMLQHRETFKIPEGLALHRVWARFDEVRGILFVYMPKLGKGCTSSAQIGEVDRERECTQKSSEFRPCHEEEEEEEEDSNGETYEDGNLLEEEECNEELKLIEEEGGYGQRLKKPNAGEEEAQEEKKLNPKGGLMDEAEATGESSQGRNDHEKKLLTPEKDHGEETEMSGTPKGGADSSFKVEEILYSSHGVEGEEEDEYSEARGGEEDEGEIGGSMSKTGRKREVRPPSRPFSATTFLAGAAVLVSLALVFLHMLKGKKR